MAAQAAAPQASPRVQLSLSNVYSFPGNQSPPGGLLLGTNGNFYATTSSSGSSSSSAGGIWEVTPGGFLTNWMVFSNHNGAQPLAPLIQSGDYLYGTTSAGGKSNHGTVFKIPLSLGAPIPLVFFAQSNGAQPYAPLLKATNGLFYGTTSSGGTNGLGTIFAMNSSGRLSNLFSFGGTNGANPYTGLIQGKDGNLYGTTRYGGTDGQGTIFVISLAGNFTNLLSFTGADGSDPSGLVRGSGSNFYGVTFSGGTHDLGTLFEMTPSGSLTTLASFSAPTGANPSGALTQAEDGAFYGVTFQGGSNGMGTVFRFRTNSGPAAMFSQTNVTFAVVSFDGMDGAYPRGALVQDTNGNLFGTTLSGGANGSGTIFEVTGFLPQTTRQPTSVAFSPGKTASFSAAAIGSGPLAYQWQLLTNGPTGSGSIILTNGPNGLGSMISGAGNATLTISGETAADVGTYWIIVTNLYGAVSNSAQLTVSAPTLTVTSPPPLSKNNATLTVSNATLTVSGTAADKTVGINVTNVQWRLGTNPAVVLTNLAAVTNLNRTTSWAWSAANLTLQPGSNLLQVWSVDQAWNASSTNSYEIFYVTISTLTTNTTGEGKIQGFTTNELTVGKTYSLTAVAAPGNLFSNWTGSITSSTAALSFLMQSNMVLTANFVTNIFLGAAGVYNGLFYATNACETNAITSSTAGMLSTLTLNSQGIYSGRLLLAGSSFNLSGSFAVAGTATNTIARATTNGGPVTVAMNLDWSNSPPTIDGTVSALETNGLRWTAILWAEPATTNGPASEAYTMLLEPGHHPPPGSPPGAGYALIATHRGTATIQGALADGTSLNQTVAVSQQGGLPLYASLYNGAGLLLGWVTNFDNGALAGNLAWIKPASPVGLYSNGLTNMPAVQGSLWTNPPAHTPALTLAQGQLVVTSSNVDLRFNVAVSNNNSLAKLPDSPTNTLTGSINPKNGRLSIVIGEGKGQSSIMIQGAALQNQEIGGGFFLTPTNAGSMSLQ